MAAVYEATFEFCSYNRHDSVMNKSDYICIHQPYPGLGDHLQHSTLPRLYHSIGKKVYISNKCKYRNKEIMELVWKANPYVSGFSDLEPNAGMNCREIQYKAVILWKPTTVSLTNIEAAHGFTRKEPRPEIYYKPKNDSKLSNYCVVDASACTAAAGYTKEIVLGLVKERFGKDVLYIKSRRLSLKDTEDFSTKDFDTHYVDSIYQYCDAIGSCKQFVSLMSGGHSLSQAIRKTENYCIIPRKLFDIHKEKGLFINDAAVTYFKF